MRQTATRTLALLSLLQARSDWSGADLPIAIEYFAATR